MRKRAEKERARAEKKALAETVKALRPEECIKHMVAVVDPGKLKSSSEWGKRAQV